MGMLNKYKQKEYGFFRNFLGLYKETISGHSGVWHGDQNWI